MGDYTAKLRKELVRNKKLATDISNVLARYDLEAPDGMMIVWGPAVIDRATSAFDIPRIWEIGIPPPELLDAMYNFQDRFRF